MKKQIQSIIFNKNFLALISVVLLIYIVVSVNKQAEIAGEIRVEIVNTKQEVVNFKNIVYSEGETLVELLDENFKNFKIKDGFVSSIDELNTPSDFSTFISIYIDDEVSPVGLEQIDFQNVEKLSFVDTIYEP